MSTSDEWIAHLTRERRPANTIAAARRVLRSLPNPDTATREDVEAWWASRAHLSPATRSNDLHHQQGKGTTMHRLLSLAAVLALAACSSAAPTAATTPTPSAAVITADPTPSATATATATPTPPDGLTPRSLAVVAVSPLRTPGRRVTASTAEPTTNSRAGCAGTAAATSEKTLDMSYRRTYTKDIRPGRKAPAETRKRTP